MVKVVERIRDPQELVELARFESCFEAAIVRGRLEVEGYDAVIDGDVLANWLWHLGPTIAAVTLSVRRQDANATIVLLESLSEKRSSFGEERPLQEDEWNESGAEGDDALEYTDFDRARIPSELIRAWRAAVIGYLFLPPLLTVYSTWILIHHGFFAKRTGNWRVPASLLANVALFIVFLHVISISTFHFGPPPARHTMPEPRTVTTEDGKEYRVVIPVYETKHRTFSIIPN
ncbi:MAG: hypothetical protein ACI9HK_002840 [Pirellulaceae bacterium]|jgi:hypothetical protein